MKKWQKVLGYLREVGPDIPAYREACKFLYAHIEALERALKELQDQGGEGE